MNHFLKIYQKELTHNIVHVAGLDLNWCLVPKVASTSISSLILPYLKQLKEAKEQARQRKYQRSLTKQSTFTSAINSSSIGRHAERSDLTVVTDSRRSSFSLPFITVDRDGKPARGARKRTQDAKLQTPAQKKNLKNKA